MTDILDEVVVDEFDREADRRMGFCDGCGPAVKAMVHVINNGGEIKYCGHHINLYRAKLNDQGAFIYNIM
jgi:hypothetical protein